MIALTLWHYAAIAALILFLRTSRKTSWFFAIFISIPAVITGPMAYAVGKSMLQHQGLENEARRLFQSGAEDISRMQDGIARYIQIKNIQGIEAKKIVKMRRIKGGISVTLEYTYQKEVAPGMFITVVYDQPVRGLSPDTADPSDAT